MPQRNATILWRELDQEIVLLDPTVGCSYTLNATGAFIWKLLDGQHSPEELANTMCGTYAIGYEQALQDVESILAAFHEHHLLAGSTPTTQSTAVEHV